MKTYIIVIIIIIVVATSCKKKNAIQGAWIRLDDTTKHLYFDAKHCFYADSTIKPSLISAKGNYNLYSDTLFITNESYYSILIFLTGVYDVSFPHFDTMKIQPLKKSYIYKGESLIMYFVRDKTNYWKTMVYNKIDSLKEEGFVFRRVLDERTIPNEDIIRIR
jgi:hypothetical protein